MLKILLCSAFLAQFSLSLAQPPGKSPDPTGVWLTQDDETGEVKSQIRIYEKNGKQYGKIIKLMREDLNHLCTECNGYRKNKPVLGMVIIENMRLVDGHWQSGRVLYPRQGRWYKLKYWLQPNDPNTLVVRGYYGPFFRTQYWRRAKN